MELRDPAVSCWVMMVTHLEEDDADVPLETTFFIIDHYWDSLGELSRQNCRNVIKFLVKNYSELMKEYIVKLPDLTRHPGLADLAVQLETLRKPLDCRTAYLLF